MNGNVLALLVVDVLSAFAATPDVDVVGLLGSVSSFDGEVPPFGVVVVVGVVGVVVVVVVVFGVVVVSVFGVVL